MNIPEFDRTPEPIDAQLNPSGYKTILDTMNSAVDKYPAQIAFSCLGVQMTYADVDRLANNFASYLQHELALRPGDRLAIQLPNILQYPVVAYGALRAGLVLVNTNPLYTPREMKHQLNDSGAKAIVILETRQALFEELLNETSLEHLLITSMADMQNLLQPTAKNSSLSHPQCIGLLDALAQGTGQSPVPVSCQPDTLAVLQYTGGTTGVSKGAMLTHSNLVANVVQILAHIGAVVEPGKEICIAPLPIYHIYAFTYNLLTLFEHGAHSVLIPNPSDLGSLVNAASQWPFTNFAGINTLFVALCANETFRRLDFSHLKMTSSGGMALTRDAAEQWQALTGVRIAEGYGLSETSPAVCLNDPQTPCLGTIGTTVVDTEIMVIDEEGQALAKGEIGELCVKGPQVMQGYWQQADESNKVFLPGGWFRTGDMAVMQADGTTKIVDRKKEMIIVSGFNVFPNEIEDMVCLHPQVRECAVIGLPDARTGERVCLYVVPTESSLGEAAVREYCRENLTPYKVPKEVTFCDELPKSNVGKILRRVLKEQSSTHPAG